MGLETGVEGVEGGTAARCGVVQVGEVVRGSSQRDGREESKARQSSQKIEWSRRKAQKQLIVPKLRI